MRRIATLIVLLVAVSAPAGAAARGPAQPHYHDFGVRLLWADSHRTAYPYQRYADESKMPTVRGVVWVHRGDCPGAARPACTLWSGTDVYLDFLLVDPEGVYHELGHVFDMQLLTAADREALMRLWRLPAGYGWDDPLVRDAKRDYWPSPREWFAEAYALCSTGERPDVSSYPYGFAYGYGYRPTRPQQRAVCALVRRAAA